jgi:DNA-directed RNA polymerase subunit B
MNKSSARTVVESYFKNNSFVESIISSYNHFLDIDLEKIVIDEGEVEPTIIPYNLEEFKIKFGKIRIGKPIFVEADGSYRELLPSEARIRKLTYSSPIYCDVSPIVNGVVPKPTEVLIGQIPILLKSKYCYLNGKSREELISLGEDPDDMGGYFIVNGNEKVVVNIEDLAQNNFLVSYDAVKKSYIGKIFSESGPYRIPVSIEDKKDSLLYISFTRISKVPLVLVLKALGLTKDEEIINAISKKRTFDSVLYNIYEYSEITDSEEAMDALAKSAGIMQSKEIRLQRIQTLVDQFLLPHIGRTPESRLSKAYNIAKYVEKFLLVKENVLDVDDKDHYMNKRIKSVGESMSDLFRFNFRLLIRDMLYNFQRIVKRGKLPPVNTIIRDKLLTARIYSSMATGTWVGDRRGVSQRLQRWNFLETISHLQRVISPLSSSQENFDARALHPTHLGRLCPIETPEGTNIGLRKNLALMTLVSSHVEEEPILSNLASFGVKLIPSLTNNKNVEK